MDEQNKIISLYHKDPQLFQFLVNIFYSSILHTKLDNIFNKLPSFAKTVIELKEIVKRCNSFQDYNLFESIKTDNELKELVTDEQYQIYLYVILNNYFLMRSFKYEFVGQIENPPYIVTFDYPAITEETFNTPYWLYHGSNIYSWHHIIKNGLKIMSGTELQKNGQAFGKGIYMTDTFEFAKQYSCLKQELNYTNILYKNKIVIGVFQVIKDPKYCFKSPNIYLITKQQDVLLRYLIVFDKTTSTTNYSDLIKSIISTNGISSNSNVSNIITNKRLNVEYKLLESNPNIYCINIITENKEWQVITKSGLEINIIFNKYPINAPSIKINNEIIKLDLLNPSNWFVSTKLNDIIALIK